MKIKTCLTAALLMAIGTIEVQAKAKAIILFVGKGGGMATSTMSFKDAGGCNFLKNSINDKEKWGGQPPSAVRVYINCFEAGDD